MAGPLSVRGRPLPPVAHCEGVVYDPMRTGIPNEVFPVRLQPRTVETIRAVAKLQGRPPSTMVREVIETIFHDDLIDDVNIGLQLRSRIEQLQPAEQAEPA